jgi:replication-associated recombination protein RarA
VADTAALGHPPAPMDGSDDPWTRVTTPRGLQGDEVISALQKEIRRGHAESAAALVVEMIDTSAEMEQVLWERLMAICVEDIGWGDLQAPVVIDALYRLHERFEVGRSERRLFAIHAARYLSAATKDRSSDEMSWWISREIRSGRVVPSIPDHALDMHTARGRRMGRDARHFFQEGAQVSPELGDRERRYRDRIMGSLGDAPASGGDTD